MARNVRIFRCPGNLRVIWSVHLKSLQRSNSSAQPCCSPPTSLHLPARFFLRKKETGTYITMSFGFSVGDFLAVIHIANKIRKDFAGAPSEFKGALDV